jgi:DNA-binding NtrC family response regulator
MDEQGRKRVLIIDDDFDILKSMMRLLSEFASVKVALGAEAALEHMDEAHATEGIVYDTVIVDFNMNGHNGAWLLEQVRTKYPDCERILISGSSQLDLSNFLSPGLVDRFLEKPVEVEDLIDAVSVED